MSRVRNLLVGIAVLASPATAQGPPAGVAADFKILVAAYGLARDPIYTEEMVAISGRVYQFMSLSHEVVIIEPIRSRVDLLDLDRKLQSEVTFGQLDEGIARIRGTLAEAIDRRSKTGKRADQVESEMTRDLAEPRLAILSEPGSGKVRLTNSSVEVAAVGEPEPDLDRLALVGAAMTAVAKLGAFRTPNDLPPFVEIDTIAALTGDRRLRPTELSYLYRLSGPPRKFRRTYRLIPALTERDREAIRRIDHLRESAPAVRYEKYRLSR